MIKGLLGIGMALVLFLMACATSLPATITPGKVQEQEKVEASWLVEWDKTIMEAKKEGKLTLFTTARPIVREAISDEFKNKYGISIEFTSGKGQELAEKVLKENRAGIYAVDLMISGPETMLNVLKPSGILGPIEPELILPEVKDPDAWFENRLPFIDGDKKMLVMMVFPSGGKFFRNTDMVNKDEIKFVRDLLNPKWKEKIVMFDPSVPGNSHVMAILDKPQGYENLKKLVEQKPMILRNERLVVEWVARGKYPVGIGASSELVIEFQQIGLPIDKVILLDIMHLTEGGSDLIMFEKAPHPNARRVFINWVLSREGATIWSKINGKQSARKDVPTEHLNPLEVRQPGMNYINMTVEEYVKGKPRKTEIITEIFRPLIE